MTDELSLVSPPWLLGAPSKGERHFAINGRPLPELIDIGGDVLGFRVRELLLREPGELASGRVVLYACRMCGDLGCGAITVRVTRVEGCYVWSELTNETPSSAVPVTWREEALERDFYFPAAQYEGVIY